MIITFDQLFLNCINIIKLWNLFSKYSYFNCIHTYVHAYTIVLYSNLFSVAYFHLFTHLSDVTVFSHRKSSENYVTLRSYCYYYYYYYKVPGTPCVFVYFYFSSIYYSYLFALFTNTSWFSFTFSSLFRINIAGACVVQTKAQFRAFIFKGFRPLSQQRHDNSRGVVVN